MINYALGGVEGLLAEDTMCLAPDDQELCVNNLTFYSVYKGVAMNSYIGSGFVGLSPKGSDDAFVPQLAEKFKSLGKNLTFAMYFPMNT